MYVYDIGCVQYGLIGRNSTWCCVKAHEDKWEKYRTVVRSALRYGKEARLTTKYKEK